MSGEEDNGRGGLVRISATDIYNAVQALRDEVRKLPQQQAYDDHEKRIRSLELKWYGIMAGILGGVIAYVAQVVHK